jgi:hypothetical protein
MSVAADDNNDGSCRSSNNDGIYIYIYICQQQVLHWVEWDDASMPTHHAIIQMLPGKKNS